MKGKISLCFSLLALCLLVLLLANPVIAKEFEYKDQSNNHTYPSGAIADLVTVYSLHESYDAKEVQEMIDRLEAIPANIIEESVKYGAKLAMIDFAIPQLEGFTDLAGEHPRGHAEHITWEDMYGVARGSEAVTTIGYTFPRDYQGSVQLDYHELFHIVSFVMLGEELTDLAEFIAIHDEEANNLDADTDYYQYIDEYFAEAAAYYYRGGDYREQLKNRAPKTHSFFAELSDRLIAIDDLTNTGLSLSWPGNKDAKTYRIYRDDQLIAAVETPNYIDKTYDAYTLHRYTIIGENSEGEIIYQSLPRNIPTEENARLIISNPDGVQIAQATENAITLEWEYVSNADYYEIYRDGHYIAETDDPFYEDFVFTSDTTFTYVVRAVNGYHEYAEFAPITAKTLQASKGIRGEVILDWPGISGDRLITDYDISPVVITTIIGMILLVIVGFLITLAIILYFVVKKNRKKLQYHR